MQRSIGWWSVICFAIVCSSTTAHGEFFQADSKRYGSPKMDIVMTEVERRQHSSVINVKITLVGSSVGSSFFLLCSIRQLAQLRGNYHYIVKLEEKLKREERKQGRSAFLLVCGPGRESLAHQSIMEIVKIQHAPLGGSLI